MEQIQNNKFEGFAVIELFGHHKVAGYVTTENFGQAALFRVDSPELPEREVTLTQGRYINSTYVPFGSKVKMPAEPGYSKLVGPGAIYAINPCTEETVRQFIEANRKLPLIPLEIAPEMKKLTSGVDEETDDELDEDDEWDERGVLIDPFEK